LELPSICQHILVITTRHSLLIPSLPYISFVSYLLDFRPFPEIYRDYFVPITHLFEVFSVMLSTGFIWRCL